MSLSFPINGALTWLSVTSHCITTKLLCQRDERGMCVASVAWHRSSLARGGKGKCNVISNQIKQTAVIRELEKHQQAKTGEIYNVIYCNI